MSTKKKWLVHLALLLAAVFYVGPLLWMVDTSLKGEHQAMAMPPVWVPHPVRIHKTYYKVVHSPAFDLTLYARNTLIIAILAAAGSVLSSSLVAYSLAKIRWHGRGVLLSVMLASMMIPFPVLMIPLFCVFRNLGWIGTSLPLWAPAFFGVPFFIFLLRQFYLTIPRELSEAAFLDGCSHFGIWWRIMLPLTRPALAVVALFAFVASWNNFLGPLVYLTHQSTFTLSVALQFYQSRSGGTSYNLLMAASTLVILPIVVLFFLAQRTFVRGIATTGLK